jgi:uncharacterized protein (DUF1810 family)
MMQDRFDLERFIDAQGPVIEQVRRELAGGRKRSHWMWFVFPQLIECTGLVNALQGRSVAEVFGSPDELKFHSCMTLFAAVPGAAPVFAAALAGDPAVR